MLNKHRETWNFYDPVEYNDKNDVKPTDITNATYYLKNVQPLQQKKGDRKPNRITNRIGTVENTG
jgi:hypothetical protein